MAVSKLSQIADSASSAGASTKLVGVEGGTTDQQYTAAQLAVGLVGNAFVNFTGPSTAVKTFTLPNSNATLLYSGSALGTPSSGTLTNCTGLPVAGGGTGAATFTTHGVLVGEGTSAVAALSVGAAGTLLAGATGADPAFSATPTLGANGGTGGAIALKGSTSGSVAVQVAAAAGTGTVFQLPATNGTSGWVLQTDGSGVTSWVAAAGGSPGGSSGQIQYNNSSAFGGTNLWVSDANTIEKYNSTTAQALKVYNTFTDASNYERGIFDWNKTSNLLTIGAEAAGTGTLRKVKIIGKSFNLDNAGNASSLNANPLVLQDFSDGGSNIYIFAVADSGASSTFYFNSSGNFKCRSSGTLGWTSSGSDASASYDTALSRSAAGVVALGTGAQGDGSATILAKTKAGVPSTSDVPAGTWALIRDTSNSTTKLYYNNAGTLMTVALT